MKALLLVFSIIILVSCSDDDSTVSNDKPKPNPCDTANRINDLMGGWSVSSLESGQPEKWYFLDARNDTLFIGDSATQSIEFCDKWPFKVVQDSIFLDRSNPSRDSIHTISIHFPCGDEFQGEVLYLYMSYMKKYTINGTKMKS